MARKTALERIDERLRELGQVEDEQNAEGQAEQTAEQPPPEEPSQKPTPPEPEPQREDENSETYKQRWLALQGVLNGEKRKVEQLQQQLGLLSQQVQQLQTAPVRQLTSEATTAEIAEHLRALHEEYGDDYTKALRTAVRGEASIIVNELLEQRLKPVEQRVVEVAQDSELDKRERWAANLEQRVPGWRNLMREPEFPAWLDSTTEKFSGKTYRQLFDDANTRWDMDRIAEFFNTYKDATGRAASKTEPAPNVDPRQKLVTPGKSHAANPPPQQPQQKIYTIAEVNAFYREVNAGKWAGREAEAAKIEADIDRANAEGRIR